jgi:cardiolipin synthase
MTTLRYPLADPGFAAGPVGTCLPGEVAVAFDAAGIELALAAIADARESIDIEMFLIGGELGLRLLHLLDAKARAGVRVRLLHREGLSIVIGHRLKLAFLALDAQSRRHPEHHFRPLVDAAFRGPLASSPIRRAGFPLHAFRRGPRFLRLAHDKIVVVDGRTAIIGGMNLATAVASNHDLLLRIDGPAVAAPALVFEADWRLATADATPIAAPEPIAASDTRATPGSASIRYLVTRPGLDGHREAVVALIEGAQQRLWLQMFFLTEPRVVAALVAAHRRGVDVQIVVDPNEYALGMRLYGAPNIARVGELVAAGVPLRAFRSRPGSQMHQKSLLVDADTVYAGATNFTAQSFLANTESSCIVRSAALAAAFDARFRDDWEHHADAPDPPQLHRRRAWARVIRTLTPLI